MEGTDLVAALAERDDPRGTPPACQPHEAAALRAAVAYAWAQAQPQGRHAVAVVHTKHYELVAASVWGRWEGTSDYYGLPTLDGAHVDVYGPQGDLDIDEIQVIDSGRTGVDLLRYQGYWLASSADPQAQAYYRQLRTTRDLSPESCALLAEIWASEQACHV